MTRFAVFLLLGPPLGFVTLFWGLLGALGIALGEPPAIGTGQIVLLPMAYALGIVPALAAALFDHVLARRGTRLRILWTALASFALAFIPLAASLAAGAIHGPYVLAFGLVGAVPGAICSWLSGVFAGHRADNRADHRAVMRWLMLAFLAGGCVLHFRATDSLVAMTPDIVPFKRAVVLATGPLEFLLGLALLVPRLRRWAGIAIAAYVVAVWPANFKHAFEHLVLPPIPDSWWYHAPRLALQPAIAWWALYGAGVIDWPFRHRRKVS